MNYCSLFFSPLHLKCSPFFLPFACLIFIAKRIFFPYCEVLKENNRRSLYPYLYLHIYTLIQYNLFTLEILWSISFFVGVVINTPRTEQFQFLLTYDAFTIQVAHWSARNKRALIPRDCRKKHNMADMEAFSPCHTTIDIESLGTATPSSLCSTPELEIRGNESCLQADLRQMPECEESLAVKNGTISLSSDTSASMVNSKSRELKNNDSSSSVSSYIE